MPRPSLFSIPAGAPFLPTFVQALLAGRIIRDFPGGDPLALASATIYAPTRRAARALAAEIARGMGGASALLPRIVPLGQSEEIETALAFDFSEEGFTESAWDEAVPPAMDELERRLSLAALILAWGRALGGAILRAEDGSGTSGARDALLVAAAPGQAWFLARDLAALIDELIIEDIPWSALDRAVPEDFDRYWAITLDFLKIARAHWPRILAARGCIEAVARRAALTARAAERIADGRGEGPSIVIGSTGTNRATALLLAAIARSPRGAVVLPGLDLDLDDAAWSLVAGARAKAGGAGHPQAALRRLLGILGASREEVEEIGEVSYPLAQRARFLREALIPAEATERWPHFDRRGLAEALEDVALIEAADEREEALALAVRLREALETPGLTAALATPDRTIAARVRAELARWGVEIDDSAGEPLASSPAGAFARLVLRAAAAPDLSIDWLALLAHDFVSLGFAHDRVRELAALAEIALARSSAPFVGDLATRLAEARRNAADPHAHSAVRRLPEGMWSDLELMLTRLAQAFSGLRTLAEGAPLAAWIGAHRRAMLAIADQEREARDCVALEALLDRLEEAARDDRTLFDAQDYLDVFESAAREIALRAGEAGHPRLKILGLLEARLMSADLVLLAGLDEAIWPPAASTGPFLNRPMREALGLTPPERRIGQTAHDFVQAMGAPRIVLSRAAKRGGSPTTPSRFLQRMQALAGPSAWRACRERGAARIALARRAERPAPTPSIGPPQPRPALDLRPTRLSVTRIETLRRDPYAIYAEFILSLAPLPPLGEPEAARAAGEELHGLLADFVRAHPAGPLPADAAARLREEALARFAGLLEDVEWRAFRWPRLERAIQAFVAWEAERRPDMERAFVEQRGELALTLADGSLFALVAIADRLEKRAGGQWTVVDYKSGGAPSVREIACGFAPQLTLEGAMIERGAFACAPPPAIAAQGLYLKLAGGGAASAPATKEKEGESAFRDLSAEHYDGAIALLSQFRNPATPYLSRPFPQFASRYGAYDHLARVKEWSSPAIDADPAQ